MFDVSSSKTNRTGTLLVFVLLLSGIVTGAAPLFSPDRVEAANSSDVANLPGGGTWAYQNQNQQNTGYSGQNAINSDNVAQLLPLWKLNLPGLAGTPVIWNGMVFVEGSASIYAVNESDGDLLWLAGPSGETGLAFATRVGVTIENGTVYAATRDNKLVALNASTGDLEWSTSVVQDAVGNLVDYAGPQGTPLVFSGKIFIGETSGDHGSRGFLRAFSENNGTLLWTFYTVPPAPTNSTNQAFYGNTWGTNGSSGCTCGGGAVWNVPAVDPRTGIIYFGTGNPSPNGNESLTRTGNQNSSLSNLYTDSVIALNSTNGNLVWYFQETPGDQRDYDQGMPVQLFNTTINGAPTEVVGAGSKGAYYYEIYAGNGTLIRRISEGIHLNMEVPGGTNNTVIYPGPGGGIDSFSTYNPVTDMVYSESNNSPNGCKPQCPPDNNTLFAADASTGSIIWTMNMTGSPAGGVSSTNTMVFTSDRNHHFMALNASSGAVLWNYTETSGGPGTFWSWGPPSVADGLVFWTTAGSATTGVLEAFAPDSGLPKPTTSMGCAPQTLAVGSSTTCNITVTRGAGDEAAPVGSMTFKTSSKGTFGSQSCTLEVLNEDQSGCSVTYTPAFGSEGTHVVSATFRDMFNVSSSMGSATLTATKRASGTAISCVPAKVPVNSQTVCTVTVSDKSPGVLETPTGSVSLTTNASGAFSVGNCILSGGKCTFNYTPNLGSEGKHQISGIYLGDTDHKTSPANKVIQAVPRTTTTAISCSAPAAKTLTRTCTVTVKDTSKGTPSVPTGSVLLSSSKLGVFLPTSCNLQGSGSTSTCTFTYTPLSPGNYTLTAAYQGDTDHNSSVRSKGFTK